MFLVAAKENGSNTRRGTFDSRGFPNQRESFSEETISTSDTNAGCLASLSWDIFICMVGTNQGFLGCRNTHANIQAKIQSFMLDSERK